MAGELNPIPTELRAYTPARIALARTGASLTTRDALDFTLAHAQARDAVHAALSLPTLIAELHARKLPVLSVQSAAPDRATYLRRPDLGRTLSDSSRALLASEPPATTEAPRLTIILADGLSALATDRHALPLLDALLPLLEADRAGQNVGQSAGQDVDKSVDKLDKTPLSGWLLTPHTLPAEASPALPAQKPASASIENPADSATWQLTPIVLAEQARVALSDEIGHALGASLTLMLLGERPGLSAADSLGAYLTWAPAPGRTDAQRNCVSNIRSGGLDPTAAAARIAYYLREARRLSLTGTALKAPPPARPHWARPTAVGSLTH
jgi:ethanolamine ammonia-lyase small subunit